MNEGTVLSAGVGGWKNRRKIRINNFRSLMMENFVDIAPITLLFGKNGSGKSSFIKAIKFLGQNLFTANAGQTIYNLDDSINIGDFEQIVLKKDTTKNISIDFEEYWEEYNVTESKRTSDIINYRINTTFKKDDDGKNLKSIVINDLVYNLTFEIFPSEKNNYEDKVIRNIVDRKNTREQIKDYFKKELLLGHSGYPNKSIEFKRRFNTTDPDIDKFFKYLDVLPFVNIPDLRFSYYNQLMNYLDFDSEKMKEMEYWVLHFVKAIPTLAKKFFNHWYVTPVREKPQVKYKLSGDKFDSKDYYGILNQVDNEIESYNKYYPGNGLPNILDFLNNSLRSLNLGQEFIIRKSKGFGSVFIKDLQGIESNLAECSSGLIQIIPIIVKSFNALYEYSDFISMRNADDSTDVIIIEQPELHLHPSLQTEVVEFIAKGKGTYIIETHSEHIIRKIQVLIAQGPPKGLSKDDVAVYYFDKDQETGITSVKEMELEDNGFFKEPWPEGFFDEASDLAYALLEAQVGRKN